MKWLEATAEELAKAAHSRKAIALVPLGNLESHGFHLPAGTDSLMVAAFCERLAARLEDKGHTAVVLPATNQAIRSMPEFNLDLPLDLYARLVRATVLKVIRNGFKNVVLVAGHSPNTGVAKTAAREAVEQEPGAKIVSFDWYSLGKAEGFADFRHGGDAETSAVAYCYPHLVRKQRIFDNPASLKEKGGDYSVAPKKRTGRMAALGLPSRHSAEKGRKFMEGALEKAVKIIENEF
ncbi:MAG: creatininase family protein [Candidatus Micrarchaeota archaeon]|nr:creatininase family protein [Candidatus Micrarchaeota archaeon]